MTIIRRLGSAPLKSAAAVTLLALAAVALTDPSPTTPAVPAAAVAATPSTAAVTDACTSTPTGYWPAGDSITEGLFGSPGQDGWRGYLADKLNALPGPCSYNWYYVGSRRTGSRNFAHDGWGGRMINQVAAFIPASLGEAPPQARPTHVVLWNAGTNDSHPPGGEPDRTAQQMLDDTSAALDRIHLAGPDVRVLIQQITLTTRNTALQQAQEEEFDNRLPALAASKGPWVRVVDMRGVEIDGVHPTDRGYMDMATRLFDALVAAGWVPGSAVDRRVSLIANADWQYVTNDQNGTQPLRANRLQVGSWERWQLVDQGNGDVALWSNSNGRYVAADNVGNAPLIANRTAVGPWERFQVVTNADGSIGLKATINGKFVSADQGGNAPLIANRDAIGAWEKFFRSAA